MKHKILYLISALLMLPATMQAQQLQPFRQGDRVAFVGNSITDGGHYHSYLWLYYMTRFPEQRLWMMNCGIGGDTSTEILNRLQADVIDRNPSVILLTYGMNDAGLFELYADTAEVWSEQRIRLARENLNKMEQQLKDLADTRIVMIGTSPYDEKTRMNNNIFPHKAANITRMVSDQEQVARRNHWEFFNFNDLMTRFNEARQQQDSTFTLCGSDRIHPDNDGHMYMAYLILKAQGMSGLPVADICIDVRKKHIERAENCSVSGLSISKDGRVAFDYLARSLPYPLDTIARGGMEFKRPQSQITTLVPDFQREMNAEMLCLKNLKKGLYRLSVDDILIDTFTAEQLDEGVNMADYMQTPQMQQARRLMTLNEDRWDMERRLRDWAWVEYDFFLKNGYADVTTPEAHAFYEQERQSNWWVASRRDIYAKMENPGVVSACHTYMEHIVDAIYRLNKPVTHRITIEMSN